MTREDIKAMLPILQAFVEGKVIECRTKPGTISTSIPNEWTEMKEIGLWNGIEYRIKPEPKYRPFKDADECWQEMLKHEPFGWVKDKEDGRLVLITEIDRVGNISLLCNGGWDFDGIKDNFTFSDGTPFGILEEE